MTLQDIRTAHRSVVQTIRDRVDALENNWIPRRDAVSRWYKLIRLENDLAQDNMESVIGNDPRSSYNLATWLLTPKTWTVTGFKEGLGEEDAQAITAFEQLVEREVMLSIRANRGRLHGSYLAQAVKLFVSTGWICLVAAPTLAHYCASKHGILGLTKTAATENIASGIRINALCPGAVDTPMLRASVMKDPNLEKLLLSRLPAGRLGRTEEIAEAAVWLCSHRASFVNGESMVVDGGSVAR